MSDNQQRIDPTIYGGKEVQPRAVSAVAGAPAGQYTPPTAVPTTSVVQGSSLLAEGAAALQTNRRGTASLRESLGAAVSQWLPAHAYDYLTTPSFALDPNFNAAEYVRGLDFRLDNADEEYILKAKSAQDAAHRAEVLRQRNLAYEAMGDHKIASFIAGALDPAYLAIDVASMGATRLLRGGRAMAGTMAAGMTAAAGLAEAEMKPTSSTEIILNSLAMGAATSLLFRRGKLEPRDAQFPAEPLRRTVEELQGTAAATRAVDDVAAVADEVVPTVPSTRTKVSHMNIGGRGNNGTKFQSLSGRAVLESIETGSDTALAGLATRVKGMLFDDVEVRVVHEKNLFQGKRPYYDPRQHAVFVAESTSPEIRLHEITHAVTSNKIEYGLKNVDSTHGKIVRELEEVRQAAREEFKRGGGNLNASHVDNTAYYLSDLHEFVSGVFTGKSAFTDMLAKMADETAPKRSLLGRVVDGVRRLLGLPVEQASALTRVIGLTEALGKERLNATLHIAGAGGYSIRLAPNAALKKLKNSKEVAQAIEWSWHKTFGSYSSKAQEIADLLMDSPTKLSGNSVTSIQRALRADLSPMQYAYESALMEAMSARGFGLLQRITNTRRAVQAQQAIEKEVYNEMLRRNRAALDGVPLNSAGVDPSITKMADHLDALSARALAELKAAGVDGADDVIASSGYVTRRWDVAKIEAIESKLLAAGLDEKAARQRVVDTIGIGIQRATGWDAEVADDIAGAIFDRTKRRGMFQDIEFQAGLGEDSTAVLRSILSAEGLTGARLQRVMDVLDGAKDEAGKMNTLKSRIDMHMDEQLLLPDGSSVTIADMLDTNVSAITDKYLDTVSARAAMAKKGLKSPSDIRNMRDALAQSVPDLSKRADAVKSFDEALNVIQGNPVGEEMLSAMRNVQALTQMMGLASSGLWQVTEYATIMAKYGAGKVVRSMVKELPFVRDMVKQEAASLREVLARNSSQDTRLRPFITRLEDNFDVPLSDSVQLSLMQAKQLVPYANAMKYIQHHQARTTANLIVDIFNRAAKGDAKAIQSLETYGLESGSMTKARADILQHGMDTSKWSHATWQEVRGPLTKMMDESVLRARLGEMPQFAHTSTLGKFLFTFRSFVLAAHNKVLANTLNNGGYSAMSLLLLYQVPLTVLATATNTALSGKPQDDLEATVAKAFGQVGALGLFSELFGVLTGNKQQFGSPGLIGVDRMYKAVGAIASGDPGDAGAALINATPLMSAILPVRAIGEALKDDKE